MSNESKSVMVNLLGHWERFGAVTDDVWEIGAVLRETPVRAYDLPMESVTAAKSLGATHVKIVEGEKEFLVVGYASLRDLIANGVRFDNQGVEYVYCPASWLTKEKWEQPSLPNM